MSKSYTTIGCCGIECGLCPRFYTEGNSRCPGCGGVDFKNKHPSCSYKTCCADKYGLEVCSQCIEYPCRKYEDRGKIERDSFVSHKRIFPNHDMIRANGFDKYLARLNERIGILKEMLAGYDDGRNKSFYCIAAALLPSSSLHSALSEVKNVEDDKKNKAKALRAILTGYADSENIELKLIK